MEITHEARWKIKRAIEHVFIHQQRIGEMRFLPSGQTIDAVADAAIAALADALEGEKVR